MDVSSLGTKSNFPLTLAPMVGLTHSGFRRMAREYLSPNARTFWPTEMLNSRRLPSEVLGRTWETFRGEEEVDLVPQILGNEEEFIAKSLRKLEAWGAVAIDINMGCPVRKALKHNYGVSLMGDIKYASQVVEITKKNTTLPVSVKLRAGLQKDEAFLLEFMKSLEASGASWLTLHPRLSEEKRRGSARWEQIQKAKSQIKIPLIGNGDVQTEDDVFAMLEQTGCDGVMVGRALTARPWLFWQVGETLGFPPPKGFEGRHAPRTPEEEGVEYGRSLLRQIDFLEQMGNENRALRQFKFFVRTSSVWLDFGHTLYAKMTNAKTLEEARTLIQLFFEKPQPLRPRTNLRI